jgi:hypothetical protein
MSFQTFASFYLVIEANVMFCELEFSMQVLFAPCLFDSIFHPAILVFIFTKYSYSHSFVFAYVHCFCPPFILLIALLNWICNRWKDVLLMGWLYDGTV